VTEPKAARPLFCLFREWSDGNISLRAVIPRRNPSLNAALKGRTAMMSVVVAMIVVLAIAAGVVVTVLIDMKSRSWRWAVKMMRLARRAARYLNRQAAQYLNREASGFPR
jgi:hypothetical protein